MPGSPGIPAVKVASKMNEFPVIERTAFDVERVGPDPPESSGFFQIYPDTGPEVGESSKMYAVNVPRIEVTVGRALVVTVTDRANEPEFDENVFPVELIPT
jgi:hypothetical protein